MKLIIKASPKEIADLISMIQSQQKQGKEKPQIKIPTNQKRWY